jgi:hypothetical protein
MDARFGMLETGIWIKGSDRLYVRDAGDSVLTVVRGGLALKLGEFVGDQEPEFKCAIERGTVSNANAGDSPFDGGVQTVLVFR